MTEKKWRAKLARIYRDIDPSLSFVDSHRLVKADGLYYGRNATVVYTHSSYCSTCWGYHVTERYLGLKTGKVYEFFDGRYARTL